MKTVYIPKGETVCYESLETEHLVVKGCLKVTYGISAKSVSGDGVLFAQTIHADDIRAREIDSGSVICKRLLADQVQARELIAVESAAVSTFLAAQTIKAGRLTVTVSEVDAVEAAEVINMDAKRRSLFGLLLISALRSLWTVMTMSPERKSKNRNEMETQDDDDHRGGSNSGDDPVMREKIAKTVREIIEQQKASTAVKPEEEKQDFEMKRIQSIFKLLRDQGYTLQIIPGRPEDNAPILDFETECAAPDAA